MTTHPESEPVSTEQQVLRWYRSHPHGTSVEAGAALELHPVTVRKIVAKARRAAHDASGVELHMCTCGDVHLPPSERLPAGLVLVKD